MYKQDSVSIQNQLRLVAPVVDYQILQPTGQLSPGRPSWGAIFSSFGCQVGCNDSSDCCKLLNVTQRSF